MQAHLADCLEFRKCQLHKMLVLNDASPGGHQWHMGNTGQIQSVIWEQLGKGQKDRDISTSKLSFGSSSPD